MILPRYHHAEAQAKAAPLAIADRDKSHAPAQPSTRGGPDGRLRPVIGEARPRIGEGETRSSDLKPAVAQFLPHAWLPICNYPDLFCRFAKRWLGCWKTWNIVSAL